MLKKVKTVLVGDAGVGKTCIAERVSHNTFNENTYATVGATNLTVEMGGPNGTVSFNIWDTAGQERYRSLAPMYFSGAYCAILVFDITSHASYETLDEFYETLQQRAPSECIYILVGNKADLAAKRQVSNEEALDYCHRIGALFYQETSALTGEGVKELFEQIVQCPDLHFEQEVGAEYVVETPTEKKNGCNC